MPKPKSRFLPPIATASIPQTKASTQQSREIPLEPIFTPILTPIKQPTATFQITPPILIQQEENIRQNILKEQLEQQNFVELQE